MKGNLQNRTRYFLNKGGTQQNNQTSHEIGRIHEQAFSKEDRQMANNGMRKMIHMTCHGNKMEIKIMEIKMKTTLKSHLYNSEWIKQQG